MSAEVNFYGSTSTTNRPKNQEIVKTSNHARIKKEFVHKQQ